MTVEITQTGSSSSLIGKGKNLTGVGLVGAWMTALVHSSGFSENVTKNLLLGVPFFSFLLVEIIIWIWCFSKLENAAIYQYRRSLKKRLNLIEKELKNQNISEEYKTKLVQKYEKVNLDLIDSYHYTDISK